MPYLVLGVVLLGLLLLTARMLVNADAAKLSRTVGWFLIGVGVAGAAAFFILLVASDRFGLALVILGSVVPLLLRKRSSKRRHSGGGGNAGGRSSVVETEILRMELDHDTGAISGQVRKGPFAGRSLDSFSESELLMLWHRCVAEDEQGARLLETYLDRLKPDWRDGKKAGAAAGGEAMTREQAFAILGLSPGADADKIKEAHRQLMMKLHPDHGGSTYLAAQINRAKDVLLGS